MITFTKVTAKDLRKIQSYTKNSNYPPCDYSGGVIYTWFSRCDVAYAIYNDTLILKTNGKYQAFFLPLGKDFYGALTQIENYAVEKCIPLNYICVDSNSLEILKNRYNNDLVYEYNRDYSDYVYNYSEMETFSGKKFSGQRNHINGFKKTYPNYKYKTIRRDDRIKLLDFLNEYKKEHKNSNRIEKNEFEYSKKLIKDFFYGEFVGGYIEVDGKVVAVSVGEYSKNSLIIHLEKALTSYRGVYPTMFNEFVKHAKKDEIIYINREDDSGDLGLRTSKEQYKPVFMVDKYFVKVNKAMPNLKKPTLKNDKVLLNAITKSDALNYYKLYTQVNNNKWWGYDYKKDFSSVDDLTFYNLQKKDFKERNNLCLAIRDIKTKDFMGEIILHNFKYDKTVEIGIRLFRKYQNKGYAKSALKLVISYVVNNLKLTPVMKCYKRNEASKRLIEGAGFIAVDCQEFIGKIGSKKDKFYYYKLK